MRSLGKSLAALMPVALALSACATDSTPTVVPSPSTAAPSLTVPSAVSTPSASGLDYGEDGPTAEPSPTWDADARTEAVVQAQATMVAFARPQMAQPQWWADLAPLLTLAAQEAYSAVDPAEVPPRRVTGDAVLTDDSSAWLARLDVPTDVGTYELLLVRADGASPWRTETITPPAAVSEPIGR